MNIVYFGTDVFLSCFEYLAQRHNILALYTYHNDEDYFTEYAITGRARELGIPVHYEVITPSRIRDYFTREGCALFFLAEYAHILELPEDLPGFRGMNVHSSLLPQGRSYYPIECAMERGLSRTGVTVHKLAPSPDTGAILAQRPVEIAPEEDSVDIYLRCAAAALEMLKELMEDLDGYWAGSLPQTEKLPYWRRPAREGLLLRHSQTRAEAAEVFRRYNGMTEVELEGRNYYVTSLMAGGAPLSGELARVAEDRWLYRVADGHLRLTVWPVPEGEMGR